MLEIAVELARDPDACADQRKYDQNKDDNRDPLVALVALDAVTDLKTYTHREI
jgi:hypothetical protein